MGFESWDHCKFSRGELPDMQPIEVNLIQEEFDTCPEGTAGRLFERRYKIEEQILCDPICGDGEFLKIQKWKPIPGVCEKERIMVLEPWDVGLHGIFHHSQRSCAEGEFMRVLLSNNPSDPSGVTVHCEADCPEGEKEAPWFPWGEEPRMGMPMSGTRIMVCVEEN